MATITGARPAARSTDATKPVVIRNPRRILSLVLIYAVLIGIALMILLPLLWMLSTSLKPKSQWFTRDIEWIPLTLTWANYQSILNNPTLPIGRWFINSVGLATAVTALTLLVDSFAAYAYARMEFKGRNLLFGMMLATLFLPGIMFLIPNFLTIVRLNLLGSYLGIILPALAGVFGVFFLRQFFETIPKELEEAAEIDGASQLQTFWLIVLPLTKSALATLGILTFLGSWNDFLWPLLILKDRALLTLPPGLAQLKGAYTSDYGVMMAGAVIVAVPVLIIYIVLQRFVVASVATTGLK